MFRAMFSPIIRKLNYVHNSVSTHPRHQPAATLVNTARYCKYSQVLLMMGENITRNMWFEACCTRLTNHIVQFQLIQDTSRQQLG